MKTRALWLAALMVGIGGGLALGGPRVGFSLSVDVPGVAVSATVLPDGADSGYFRMALAPYGNWVEYDTYGLAWRPAVSARDRSWRPYCHDGRWVWTDQGWYWLSSYSWGWATFHYGRWVYSSMYGWLWIPDTEWAPAWVYWRHSDPYVGWAPLPPGAGFSAEWGYSYYGERVGFGFQFNLTDRDYVFVSGSQVMSLNLPTMVVPAFALLGRSRPLPGLRWNPRESGIQIGHDVITQPVMKQKFGPGYYASPGMTINGSDGRLTPLQPGVIGYPSEPIGSRHRVDIRPQSVTPISPFSQPMQSKAPAAMSANPWMQPQVNAGGTVKGMANGAAPLPYSKGGAPVVGPQGGAGKAGAGMPVAPAPAGKGGVPGEDPYGKGGGGGGMGGFGK